MGWLGRGLGDFGSAVGQGYDINLGWKERLQQMALANARQKLEDLMGPLQLQELQTRIKQMQGTQPAGIEKGATGALSGIKWNPKTQQYEMQELAPGGPSTTKITTPFEAWRAENPNAPLTDWFKLERPPQKIPEGYEDIKTDRNGNLWGTRKDNGKFEQIPTTAKFPVPKEGAGNAPGDVDALAYDIAAGKALMPTGKFGAAVAKRMKELGIEPPLRKPPKPVPPDILAMLNGPIPKSPTAEQSRRLADAADRVFGGTAYKQDLIAQGRRSPFMGLRSPYAAASYDSAQYADMIGLLKQSIATQGANDLSDLGGSPVAQ